MKYRIDLTTGRCESSPLTTAFVPFGVPSGATFNNIDYLGAELAGLGLKVDSFNEKTGLFACNLASITTIGVHAMCFRIWW